MTDREEFEKWFSKQLDTGYAFTSDEQITSWAWQARGELERLKSTPPSREWVGLSYEEILRLEGLDCVDEEYIKRFARAVEQALREKNK